MPGTPSIVFAHGLWADGSCFSKVIELLVADGYEVIATQNHLNTVPDDAAAVRTSMGRARGPVVPTVCQCPLSAISRHCAVLDALASAAQPVADRGCGRGQKDLLRRSLTSVATSDESL